MWPHLIPLFRKENMGKSRCNGADCTVFGIKTRQNLRDISRIPHSRKQGLYRVGTGYQKMGVREICRATALKIVSSQWTQVSELLNIAVFIGVVWLTPELCLEVEKLSIHCT